MGGLRNWRQGRGRHQSRSLLAWPISISGRGEDIGHAGSAGGEAIMRDGLEGVEPFAPIGEPKTDKRGNQPGHVPITPVPEDAPTASFRHAQWGLPTATWE